MNDKDYFHLMMSVFLVLVLLVMAAVLEWTMRHPELVVVVGSV